MVQNKDNLYWEPNDDTNFKMLYNYNRLLKDSVKICEIYFHWIYKYSIVLLINCKSHSLMDKNYCRSYYFLFLIYFVCLFAFFGVFILLCFVFYFVLTFVLCVYPDSDFAWECLGSWILCSGMSWVMGTLPGNVVGHAYFVFTRLVILRTNCIPLCTKANFQIIVTLSFVYDETQMKMRQDKTKIK